jgi:hypothetical protein
MNRRSPGLIFIAACVAALALRLVIPAGWMPAASGPLLSLCSGVVQAGDPAQPAGDAADQPCGFALALGPWLAAAAVLLPLLALPHFASLLPAPVSQPARRHRPRPPGQGPPAA